MTKHTTACPQHPPCWKHAPSLKRCTMPTAAPLTRAMADLGFIPAATSQQSIWIPAHYMPAHSTLATTMTSLVLHANLTPSGCRLSTKPTAIIATAQNNKNRFYDTKYVTQGAAPTVNISAHALSAANNQATTHDQQCCRRIIRAANIATCTNNSWQATPEPPASLAHKAACSHHIHTSPSCSSCCPECLGTIQSLQ